MTGLTLQLGQEALEQIAQRAADILAERSAPVPEYLTPQEAADYMRCSKQRVYDLTSAGRLKVCKDGARNLYRRVDLDAYLSDGGQR
jgi:excisionase family DNA binding protein